LIWGLLFIVFTLKSLRRAMIHALSNQQLFDVKEEAIANASYATIEPLAKVAELVKTHFIKNKAAKDAT
jgi:hypothetical protein